MAYEYALMRVCLLPSVDYSWGTVYFPEVWMHLHTALVEESYDDIPGTLVNGWSGSWKKYLFSLMYHNDWYLLYPGYKQEQSFATNHMEDGVHIGKGSIQHLPEVIERERERRAWAVCVVRACLVDCTCIA